MNQFRMLFFFFYCIMSFNCFSQEIPEVVQEELVHDPHEVNKYYFSLLPSAVSTMILLYHFKKSPHIHHPELIFVSTIDKALVANKISDAAFWGSFNIMIYENCLFHTAFSGGNLFCALLYLARGKHPTHSRGQYESTCPLDLALSTPHPSVVSMLLNAGADPNYKDCENSDYPLCKAAQKNNPECVRLLLAKGAHKDLGTALQLGAKNNSTQIVRLLLEAGADPNKIPSGYKALVEAAEHQNIEMVQLLLKHGAKINPSRYHLRYALQRALSTKNTALASILQNGGSCLP